MTTREVWLNLPRGDEKTQLSFDIIDHGVARDWPDRDTVRGPYEQAVTGQGLSARQAAEDAFSTFVEMLPDDVEVRHLSDVRQKVKSLLAIEDAHDGCPRAYAEGVGGWDPLHDGCPRRHFVSIRWNVIRHAIV